MLLCSIKFQWFCRQNFSRILFTLETFPSLLSALAINPDIAKLVSGASPPIWIYPGSRSWQKAQKRNMCVLQLCSVLCRLKAEITRNRNGHTRSLKCSHFGIFSVVNRPYLKLFHVTYQVNGSSRNLTPRDTTHDAFMDKYIRVQELIFQGRPGGG